MPETEEQPIPRKVHLGLHWQTDGNIAHVAPLGSIEGDTFEEIMAAAAQLLREAADFFEDPDSLDEDFDTYRKRQDRWSY